MNTLRPLRRGESNLGSIQYLTVFTTDQFESFIKFPVRGKGEFVDMIPVKYGEEGARWHFDLGKGKGAWKGSGPITNKTYWHTITGTVSGMTREQLNTLDDTYNRGIIAIAHYQNGLRKVYGSTQFPLQLTVEGSIQSAPEGEGKTMTIILENIVGADFPPKKLASTVDIFEATVLPYMTGGFTFGFNDGYNNT